MKMRIREARERIGLTQRDLALKVGVAPNTFHGYESGKHDPKSELLVKIANICGVTVDYLLGRDEPQNSGLGKYSFAALALAERYDGLDMYGRRLLDAVAGEEERRRLEQNQRDYRPVLMHRGKFIPLFTANFAAGPGEPNFGNIFEQYEVDENERADFAIRIRGDSMEPWLHDGQIALGRIAPPSSGDVAAVWMDGAYHVKQWSRDASGNLCLRSLNRKRADLDRTILARRENDVRCIGVIDLAERPPLIP